MLYGSVSLNIRQAVVAVAVMPVGVLELVMMGGVLMLMIQMVGGCDQHGRMNLKSTKIVTETHRAPWASWCRINSFKGCHGEAYLIQPHVI